MFVRAINITVSVGRVCVCVRVEQECYHYGLVDDFAAVHDRGVDWGRGGQRVSECVELLAIIIVTSRLCTSSLCLMALCEFPAAR